MAVVQCLSRARPPLKRSSSAAALFCSSVEDAEGVAAIERICHWVAALKLPARGIAAANVPWNAIRPVINGGDPQDNDAQGGVWISVRSISMA